MDFVYYKNNKVDVYIPNKPNFTTIIYFHGGGLVEGSRSQENLVEICNRFKELNFCVFNFDYSLYPNAKFPDYIIDAAEAVKCAIKKSAELGGNGKFFVSGSSAGAYLSAMLLSNKKYLKDVGVDSSKINGWFLESGQMTDHFHVIEFEEHLDPKIEKITRFSPTFYINDEFKCSPIKLLVYENDIPNRVKQNIKFKDLIAKNNANKISLTILKGCHCEGSSKKDTDGEYPFIKEFLNFIQDC